MKRLELTLWIVGVMLLLAFGVVLGWQEMERRSEVAAFTSLQKNIAVATSRMPRQALARPETLDSPDSAVHVASSALEGAVAPASTSTGVPERVRAVPNTRKGVPIAILRIPAIGLVVPVNVGTGAGTLRRGAGLVAGSPLPGAIGNIAIAAHRDSFFRGLKDVSINDTIELDALGHTQLYRITKLTVVQPTDVKVLANVGEPVLTLITCYPFYFVGHAPKRFIVRAVATNFRR